jgi:hypothetical protein
MLRKGADVFWHGCESPMPNCASCSPDAIALRDAIRRLAARCVAPHRAPHLGRRAWRVCTSTLDIEVR